MITHSQVNDTHSQVMRNEYVNKFKKYYFTFILNFNLHITDSCSRLLKYVKVKIDVLTFQYSKESNTRI